MRTVFVVAVIIIVFMLFGCTANHSETGGDVVKMLFLHHSTGEGVWVGGESKTAYKLTQKGKVEKLIADHNGKYGTNYTIEESNFPKSSPYGWKNYPYDYYNIWVKNAGEEPYMEEPTLEMLTPDYDVIIFKHCFPVSFVSSDTLQTDVDSEKKTLANYKLQYNALKEKIHTYNNTSFVVWTGAALVEGVTNEQQASLAKEFSDWVINTWDETGDNIYIWDFRSLETEGGLYLKQEYATSTSDSHPNKEFNGMAAELFVNRLLDIVENNGEKTDLKGEIKE